MSETAKGGNRGSEVEELADLSSFLLDALSSEGGQWGHEEKSETFGSFGDIRPGKYLEGRRRRTKSNLYRLGQLPAAAIESNVP